MASRYNHTKIEKKWQRVWEKKKAFRALHPSEKRKYYCLIEFPYPSGEGLHVGHVRSYTAMDIIARKRRMEGYNVLYPIGWDAFGLPTEQYAVKTGIHPKIVTKKNSDTFRRQLKSLGFSFDWEREINTTDPEYYKWTQWIFLKFFEQGLAYKAKTTINWCPKDKIGLANEEVVGGECERCGTPVEKREKEQWMLKITAYAEKLLKGLEDVDYIPEAKTQQTNWIGRSEGALINFKIQDTRYKIQVFTTRPDTLFGATYVVAAPEHPLITNNELGIRNYGEVKKYIEATKARSEEDRIAQGREKTGVELEGVKAINPANGEEIPMWIADYVLGHVGTGAIMAVPAHDERDFEFAKKYKLSIKNVIEPVFIQSTEPGKVVDDLPFEHRDAIIAIVKHWSEEKYIGLKWQKVAWGTFITGGIEKGQTAEDAAKREIREETGFLHPKLVADFGVVHGKFYHVPKKVNRFGHARVLYFELKDGVKENISGEEQENHEVLWLSKGELERFLTSDSHKRVLEILSGKMVYTGEGTLTNSGKFNGTDSEKAKWEITKFVGGEKKVQYRLRDWVFSRQRYWGEPIPLIFCEKCGWVPVPEKELPVMLPNVKKFQPRDDGESPLASVRSWVEVKCPECNGSARRETDVMPNWAGSSWYFLRYTDPGNKRMFADSRKLKYWTPVDWYNGGMEHTTLHLLYSRFWHQFLYEMKLVPASEPYKKRTSHGLILGEGGVKMSKSKGNVVNPDDVIKTFGADTLRLYEMFVGPFNQPVVWDPKSIVGIKRFLERVWRTRDKIGGGKADETLLSALHRTIKKVSDDIEAMHFNTAVSALMIMAHEIEKEEAIPRSVYKLYLTLLAPFAPYVADELWEQLGNKKSIHSEKWPQHDESFMKENTFKLIVQINGRVRDTIFFIPIGISQKEAEERSLARPRVQKYIKDKQVRKIIFVPNRLINIVI